MPRYRAIYIAWLVGAVLIVGMWLYSVQHYIALGKISHSGTYWKLTLSGGGISLEVVKYPAGRPAPRLALLE